MKRRKIYKNVNVAVYGKDTDSIIFIQSKTGNKKYFVHAMECRDTKSQARIVQTLNPRAKRWIKIDRKLGKVIGHKRTAGPYKGVAIEN